MFENTNSYDISCKLTKKYELGHVSIYSTLVKEYKKVLCVFIRRMLFYIPYSNAG